MNKIFKVIWNNAKHCYVVASELAKSYSRGGSRRSIRRAAIAVGVAAAVYTTAGSALAVIDGGDLDTSGNYTGHSPYNVIIDNSNVTGNVYGHKGNDSEDVEEASVDIVNGGTVNNSVYGGYTNSGTASSNSVNISDGTINATVSGGFSISGISASNSVNILGGNIEQDVYGAYSKSGEATNNSVNISGGSMTNVIGGYSYEVKSASNSVNISGGSMANVYGGYSQESNAVNNSTIISGDTTVISEEAYGGKSYSGNAESNSAIISGGNIKSATGGYSYSSDAASNSVNVSGGSLKKFWVVILIPVIPLAILSTSVAER